MHLKTLTKTAAADPKDTSSRHLFKDYFTGEVLIYEPKDTSLPCRVPVGGDLLDVMDSRWSLAS